MTPSPTCLCGKTTLFDFVARNVLAPGTYGCVSCSSRIFIPPNDPPLNGSGMIFQGQGPGPASEGYPVPKEDRERVFLIGEERT